MGFFSFFFNMNIFIRKSRYFLLKERVIHSGLNLRAGIKKTWVITVPTLGPRDKLIAIFNQTSVNLIQM
jgi:hypothetical protein